MNIPGAGPDTPTITNEQGGSQSHIPYRFDLIDGPALAKMAEAMYHGEIKHGAGQNWRQVPINDHLNHLIMHAYAYMSGDRTDEHLSHIMCRAMFAQALEITQEEILQPVASIDWYPKAKVSIKHSDGTYEDGWVDSAAVLHRITCSGNHDLNKPCTR